MCAPPGEEQGPSLIAILPFCPPGSLPWLLWPSSPCCSLCACHPPKHASVSDILLTLVGSQTLDKWSQIPYILLWFAAFVTHISTRSIYADGDSCSSPIRLNSIAWIFFGWHFSVWHLACFMGLFFFFFAIKNHASRSTVFLFLSLNILNNVYYSLKNKTKP